MCRLRPVPACPALDAFRPGVCAMSMSDWRRPRGQTAAPAATAVACRKHNKPVQRRSGGYLCNANPEVPHLLCGSCGCDVESGELCERCASTAGSSVDATGGH